MEQVKTFLKYIEEKSDAEKLESKINKWLQENEKITITQRFMKVMDDDYILVTIFYTKGLTV